MAPTLRWISLSGPALVAGVLGVAGCRSGTSQEGSHRPVPVAAPARPVEARSPAASAATDRKQPPRERDTRPLRRCFSELPVWVDPPVADLLDRAAEFLEVTDLEGALVCAEEASRQEPRSIEAHHDRALALVRLGRLEEARDALNLALAIAPEDAATLELAAELYVNQLAPTAERTAIGLEYAVRGRKRAGARDRARAARLALLEGQALIDLGRASEALGPLARATKLNPADAAALYEQGVALFELCRFAEARAAFRGVIARDPKHAHAVYHLGLIEERVGDEAAAADHFRRASALDSKSFPPVPNVSPSEFRRRMDGVIARLPPDVRADLARLPVEAAELPAPEDLTAERPPLSPTILGLFRGLPLGREPASESRPLARGRQARMNAGVGTVDGEGASEAVPSRAIVLYRRNILRSIQDPAELDRAIERTLLHEVGHLRGEDDGSLRDRGLE